MMSTEAVDKISGRTFSNDLSMVDDREAIAKAFGFVHVVGRQQDGAAGLLKNADDVPKLAAALWIKPGGGFVEKKNFRIAHERGSHCQTLPLSSGKFADSGICLLGKLQFFQHFGRRTRTTIEAGKKIQGFADGKFFRKARFLQRDAKQFPKFALIGLPVAPENRDLTRGGIEQAFKNFNRRGLAGTVRTEQAETFARLNLEIEPADGFNFAVVGLAQIATLNGGRHLRHFSREWDVAPEIVDNLLSRDLGLESSLSAGTSFHASAATRVHLTAFLLNARVSFARYEYHSDRC
jgi:hypothetical protein